MLWFLRLIVYGLCVLFVCCVLCHAMDVILIYVSFPLVWFLPGIVLRCDVLCYFVMSCLCLALSCLALLCFALFLTSSRLALSCSCFVLSCLWTPAFVFVSSWTISNRLSPSSGYGLGYVRVWGWSCLVLCCLILWLSCTVLSCGCLVLSCLVLSCLVVVLSCLILSCLVSSCLLHLGFFSSSLGLSVLDPFCWTLSALLWSDSLYF